MKYSIDRIEEEIAIVENLETGEKKEIKIHILPYGIKDGSILVENNNTFTLDQNEEAKRREEMMNRFNRLRKK